MANIHFPHLIDYASSYFAHTDCIPPKTVCGIALNTVVYMYHMEKEAHTSQPIVSQHIEVERVQTGVRLEKRMLKVLKAIAEQKDMSLGDLLEGIVLHASKERRRFRRRHSRILSSSAAFTDSPCAPRTATNCGSGDKRTVLVLM